MRKDTNFRAHSSNETQWDVVELLVVFLIAPIPKWLISLKTGTTTSVARDASSIRSQQRQDTNPNEISASNGSSGSESHQNKNGSSSASWSENQGTRPTSGILGIVSAPRNGRAAHFDFAKLFLWQTSELCVAGTSWRRFPRRAPGFCEPLNQF